MESFGALNWGIVIVYLLGNLLLGWFMSRKISTAEDYYIGDRSSPWWAIGISVIATYVSALSFLGGPAWAYGDGMAALAIHINYPIVIFIVVVFFLPFFYSSGVASIYDYLERRFGKRSRAIMSGLFLVTQTITTASILTATAFVITFATGIEPKTAIIIMSVIVVGYTLMGGMNAVIWTDVLQGFILFLGAGIIFYILIGEVSPMSGALTMLGENDKLNPLNWSLDFSVAPTVWAGVVAMTLFHVTVYGGNQMMVQRTLGAKSMGDAKKSYLLMGFAAFFIYFLFFFIGALLYVYFKGKVFVEPNQIILIFANMLAIPGLMGIIAAAILSASMSSLSSALNSLATISVLDFYQPYMKKDGDEKHYLTASRIFTITWAIFIIPIAFAFIDSKGSILETFTEVSSYFVGAQLAIFGLGFFSKHTTERGLIIGVIVGFIGVYAFAAGIPFTDWTPPTIAWPWLVVIGGAINIVVSIIASLMLDGKQEIWHEQTVKGQQLKFAAESLPEKVDGWYVVPGKVDKVVWLLPILFIFIMLFLAYFSTLG